MPRGREFVETLAGTLPRVTVPRVVAPAVKVMVPTGCAPVEEVTFPVKVTVCPCADGFIDDAMVVVCNFTPVIRDGYRIGVPAAGYYREVLNTDSEVYGGSNAGNQGGAWAVPSPHAGRPFHLSLRLPPLGVVYLKVPSGS